MTSDDDNKPALGQKPVNFDSMSIDDLHDYIAALTEEIEKTKKVITKKEAAQNAAAGFFKS
ncbi:DUF1192 domain-containing protein [Sneathiella sp.]|uniref:DUF1192 domain-containing protein n=1 Tax=Sneathiella sp. TaxID=1964365 RepID=UPI0026020355|nr:DUF1192 domain-containing protein [Sneathiella sp.]MDF2367747.1 DUF1192 domain-containing protein [Sneathiella sp.]